MMHRVSRLLLKAITIGAPVLIAACYGPAIGFHKRGTVVDSVTTNPIPGIQVDCLNGGNVDPLATTASGPDGSFSLEADGCEQLRFTDIDGAANGVYTTQTVTAVDDGAELSVELVPTT